MSKYSIILPVRNGGAYLKECVQSILAQTYADFNLLVLDNCSTDGSPEYLASLHDSRIKVYPAAQPLSIEENWARIVPLQKNEFITLIGHDDILLPHYLQEMDALIKQHPGASLYQAHFSYINELGNFVAHCKPMDERQYAHEFLACQMAGTIDSTGTGYMMRSSDFNAIGGLPADYPNLIFADYKAWVSLSMKSYKATTPVGCFYYRIHNSVSKLTNGEEYFIAFDKYIHFIADIRQQDTRIHTVVNRYAHGMLMYYCESLAHRVLKTPLANRRIRAASLVARFKTYAALLIPGQQFDPMSAFRIRIATRLDSNAAGRAIFGMYKSITR
jgi:glycosyltransferase involved in cell wall biosynthesis